jgi:hypothetical protein
VREFAGTQHGPHRALLEWPVFQPQFFPSLWPDQEISSQFPIVWQPVKVA